MSIKWERCNSHQPDTVNPSLFEMFSDFEIPDLPCISVPSLFAGPSSSASSLNIVHPSALPILGPLLIILSPWVIPSHLMTLFNHLYGVVFKIQIAIKNLGLQVKKKILG